MNLSSQFKGTITELIVATYFLKLGYVVSQPLVQDSKYDLIIDVNHTLIRVQVKTARSLDCSSGECIVFNCRSTTNNVRECHNRRYSPDDIDYFATAWGDNVYLIPVKECSAEKRLWISNPPNLTCCQAKNYLAEEVIKTV